MNQADSTADEFPTRLNALSGECAAEARQARDERRKFQRSNIGTMARTLEDALSDYQDALAGGVAREHAELGFAEVLRSCFHVTRYPQCDACDGTGYREKFCTHAMRCGRVRCSLTEPEYEHAYVVLCDCPLGSRFTSKALSDADQIAAAGRVSKPTRFGHR